MPQNEYPQVWDTEWYVYHTKKSLGLYDLAGASIQYNL